MSIAPGTNCWTRSEDVLVTGLSELAEFQAWSNSADSVEALTKIYVDELPEPDDGEAEDPTWRIANPQVCIVTSAPAEPFGIERRNSVHGWGPSGVLSFILEEAVTAEDYLNNRAAVSRDKKNSVGTMIKQLWEWCYQNGGIAPLQIPVISGPMFTSQYEHQTIGAVLGTIVNVRWSYI